MVKKILLFSFIVILGLFFFKTPCQAAYKEFGTLSLKNALEEPSMNLEQTSAYVANSLGRLVQSWSIGETNSVEISQNGYLQFAEGASPGAVGYLAFATGSLYQPPVNNGTYLADVINKINPSRHFTAYAGDPGFLDYHGGFTALNPVLRIWKSFRNIAYLFFIVIFVVVGFMVMFRQKINPQTTISIQNSLPRIVIALILVTFSYSISALFVDILQIGMRFTAAIITQEDILTSCVFSNDPACTQILDDDGNQIFPIDISIFNIIGQVVIQPAVEPGAIAGSPAFSAISSILSVTDWISDVLGGLRLGGNEQNIEGNVLIGLIFALTIVFVAFKIFFALLTRYVQIIIGTIFSPFVFLLGAFPNLNVSSAWAKAMLANALCFPAVFFLLLLASAISGYPSLWISGQGLTVFQWAPELLAGAAKSSIGSFVAFGILLIIPTVPPAIENALHGRPGGAQVDLGDLKKAARFIPVIGSFIG
ncbi:hypothetical protein KKD62_03025 [Patescibacteria group bacterium]|nr:hypothetical protein [Patescibacteria group bacterium]MBU1931505.1 hypothetical protein [Patescibacteria group bacterium]